MLQPSPIIILPLALSALVLAVRRVVNLLSFHPLSKYPGPPLAAVTSLYRAYFDIVKDGEWVNHLFSLHAKYGDLLSTCSLIPGLTTCSQGTVVRVGPNEVSTIPGNCDDAE